MFATSTSGFSARVAEGALVDGCVYLWSVVASGPGVQPVSAGQFVFNVDTQREGRQPAIPAAGVTVAAVSGEPVWGPGQSWPSGQFSTLVRNDDGTWLVTDLNRVVTTFSATTDTTAVATPTAVWTADSAEFRLEYTDGQLTALADQVSGRSVEVVLGRDTALAAATFGAVRFVRGRSLAKAAAGRSGSVAGNAERSVLGDGAGGRLSRRSDTIELLDTRFLGGDPFDAAMINPNLGRVGELPHIRITQEFDGSFEGDVIRLFRGLDGR